MSQPFTGRREVADDGAEGPVVRDKRRIDPETGQPRVSAGAAAQASTEEQPTPPQPAAEQPTVQQPTAEQPTAEQPATEPAPSADGQPTQLTPDSELAAERLRDLQRLQAE